MCVGLCSRKCAKTHLFRHTTTRNRFLNGINNIREKVPARSKLLCALPTNRGLGPKLKLPPCTIRKQARPSHAESIAYTVSRDKACFSGKAEFGNPRICPATRRVSGPWGPRVVSRFVVQAFQPASGLLILPVELTFGVKRCRVQGEGGGKAEGTGKRGPRGSRTCGGFNRETGPDV